MKNLVASFAMETSVTSKELTQNRENPKKNVVDSPREVTVRITAEPEAGN